MVPHRDLNSEFDYGQGPRNLLLTNNVSTHNPLAILRSTAFRDKSLELFLNLSIVIDLLLCDLLIHLTHICQKCMNGSWIH
jgi:hypothetical protein